MKKKTKKKLIKNAQSFMLYGGGALFVVIAAVGLGGANQESLTPLEAVISVLVGVVALALGGFFWCAGIYLDNKPDD